MAASNAGSGCAPKNGRPPIRNASVPGIPKPLVELLVGPHRRGERRVGDIPVEQCH